MIEEMYKGQIEKTYSLDEYSFYKLTDTIIVGRQDGAMCHIYPDDIYDAWEDVLGLEEGKEIEDWEDGCGFSVRYVLAESLPHHEVLMYKHDRKEGCRREVTEREIQPMHTATSLHNARVYANKLALTLDEKDWPFTDIVIYDGNSGDLIEMVFDCTEYPLPDEYECIDDNYYKLKGIE